MNYHQPTCTQHKQEDSTSAMKQTLQASGLRYFNIKEHFRRWLHLWTWAFVIWRKEDENLSKTLHWLNFYILISIYSHLTHGFYIDDFKGNFPSQGIKVSSDHLNSGRDKLSGKLSFPGEPLLFRCQQDWIPHCQEKKERKKDHQPRENKR